jgi:microcystin degradation protein MlrC
VDEAIRRAMDAPERPVFLSDSGDNVTAGGAGDISLFAERLLALGAQDAVVAGLADPRAVEQCAAAGRGAEVNLSIGGKLDRAHGPPLAVRGRVLHLGPGAPPATATVRVAGVTLILATDRRAFTDRASIAAAGVDPMAHKIVVVKLGYLFPDLYDHAPRAMMALSPGATDLRLERLPYRRLSRPLYPLDVALDWEP